MSNKPDSSKTTLKFEAGDGVTNIHRLLGQCARFEEYSDLTIETVATNGYVLTDKEGNVYAGAYDSVLIPIDEKEAHILNRKKKGRINKFMEEFLTTVVYLIPAFIIVSLWSIFASAQYESAKALFEILDLEFGIVCSIIFGTLSFITSTALLGKITCSASGSLKEYISSLEALGY